MILRPLLGHGSGSSRRRWLEEPIPAALSRNLNVLCSEPSCAPSKKEKAGPRALHFRSCVSRSASSISSLGCFLSAMKMQFQAAQKAFKDALKDTCSNTAKSMRMAWPWSGLKRWYTCHKAARPARSWPLRFLGNVNDGLGQCSVEVVPAAAGRLERGNARTIQCLAAIGAF